MTKDQSLQKKVSRRFFLKVGALGAGAAGTGLIGVINADASQQEKPFLDSAENATADKIMGVDYTAAEWEQATGSLESYASRYAARRAAFMPGNEVAPATVFDPRLPGRHYDAGVAGDAGTPTAPSFKTQSTEDIAFAPSYAHQVWMERGDITSRALTELYLNRIAKHGPRLENFITVTADLALDQADAADARRRSGATGPLLGIPYAMKDLADTKGIKTTWGAAPYKERVADKDATIVTKLRKAGAVLLGKTSLGALAYGDLWFGGFTRNPWAPEEGSSGSSAGSASATAAGLCSFSIGTETLGSIVSPSTRCGTVGLRPTFGRISRAGAMALCWSLDKFGPITRDVHDTYSVLAAVNGYDAGDASSLDMPLGAPVAEAPLKVGYSKAWFGDNATDTDRAVLATLKNMPNITLVEIDLPAIPIGALFTILEAECASAFEELTLSNRDDEMAWQQDNAWPNTFRAARFLSAVEFVQADRLRRSLMEGMAKLYDTVDVIACPNFAGGMLTITNYTGSPSLTIPVGFEERPLSPRTGQADAKPGPVTRLPHTFTLWGNMFREDQLVALGRGVQAAMNLGSARPSLG